MKKVLSLILMLALVFVLAACGETPAPAEEGNTPAPAGDTPAPAEETKKISVNRRTALSISARRSAPAATRSRQPARRHRTAMTS